jgi:hypothetical protein
MQEAPLLFEAEQKAYEAKKAELLKLCEGKYVVFKGNELLGTYDTPAAAYEAGTLEWGDESFLVKKITREEPLEQVPALYRGIAYAGI